MSNFSIDLSNKLDRPTIELFQAVDRAAKSLGVQYLVVGATARDMLFHHGYGLEVVRATADTDFGFQVGDWDQFNEIRRHLLNDGFIETSLSHRLLGPISQIVDLIPFGGVADKHNDIKWPPEFDVVMKVQGFDDALAAAVLVRIDDVEEVSIPIASAAGLALLKLIAWRNRPAELRRKDARDLVYLAKSYDKLPYVELYDDDGLLEHFDYDVSHVGAYLLGKEIGVICSPQSRDYVAGYLLDGDGRKRFDLLVDDSLEYRSAPRKDNESLLSALREGFECEV